jgi:hypothetical protein
LSVLVGRSWILGQVAADVVADYFAYYAHGSASAVDDMLRRMRADLHARRNLLYAEIQDARSFESPISPSISSAKKRLIEPTRYFSVSFSSLIATFSSIQQQTPNVKLIGTERTVASAAGGPPC